MPGNNYSRKYYSDFRKHRYELLDESEKQANTIFLHEKETTEIMDGIAVEARKFRIRLEFKEHDTISTKEQTVLATIMTIFEKQNMQTQ